MRLKLVLIVSLVAALVGSGASIAIIFTRFSSLKMLSNPDLLVAVTFVLPIVTVFLAALFVYRHTARRRKTQALFTGVLAAFLSLTFFFLGSILTSESPPIERQPTVPRNAG
jgi:uncharacterized BrkB/YihY/UPF0761 family membrane protein